MTDHPSHKFHADADKPCACGAYRESGRGAKPCLLSLPRLPDAVSHPNHYNAHPSGVECITVVEHFNFNRGNAIKYVWRAGDKGSEIEDLKKARWYLDREISRLEGEKKT